MKTIFTAFLLFVSLIIQAQTSYFIDPSGSDATGNGTTGNPWKSLFKACASVKISGNIIHVNAGTFTETVQSILAVGVSIEGTGVTSIIISKITTAYAGTLYLASGTEGTNGNQHISGIYFDGNNRTTYCAIWVRARSNVKIFNCTFINYDKYGVRFHGEVAGSSPSTSVIYATGNSVHDCVITNCAYYQHNIGGGADLFMSCQTGFDCYNNNITQSRTAYTNGCGVKTDGWTRGLQIHGNTMTGQILSDKEVTDSWDFAIEMWGDVGSITEGTHIYNNNIYNWEIDISGRITQKGSYDYGCSIHDNFIGCVSLPPVSKIGIILEANTSLDNIWIYNNHFKNVKTGIILWATNQTPLPLFFNNIYVYYNIFENLGYDVNGADARAFMWYNGTGTTHTVDNLVICNNVMTAEFRVGPSSDAIALVSKTGVTSSNFTIKNNIIVGFTGYAIATRNWSVATGTISNLEIQNNIINGNGHSNVLSITISTPGYVNSGNLTSNPLFVSTSDFHLQSGSPAIGKGIQIVSLTTDYDSVVISNPPEIGAYEYLSSVPTVTFTTASQSKAENGGTATITAQLSATTEVDVTIPFTVTGTAINPADYTVTSSPIMILAGSTSGTATVTIVNDTDNEADETVILTMGTPINTMQGATTVHTLTITDDDPAPVTYYIDPAGNNGNTGSIGSPWLTLTYACAHAKTSGDIIHVNAGTFLETVQSSLAVGVSIEGEGVTSIIKSHISAANTPTIVLTSGSQGTNGNQSVSKIKMDGDALTAYSAIKITARSNVLIHDCTFIDFNNNGVIFNGGLSDGLPTIWATGNKFYNNIVTNCSKYVVGSEGRWALGINGQDGMLVYNNTMTQTSRPAGNNGYLIKSVEGYNKGLKIYNNTLTRAPAVSGSFDFAIELWNCRGGIEIYNNTLKGSIDFGGRSTVKGTYPFSAYIHHNIIGETTLNTHVQSVRGILLESTIEDVIIEKNYINNVASGIFFAQDLQEVKYVKNLYIQYNIFNNIGSGALASTGWGILWSQEETAPHIIDNVNIRNNVFIGNSSLASNMWGIGLPRIGKATNINIRNNIIQGFNYGPTYSNGGTGISIDYLSIENNIFYNNGNDNIPRYYLITPTHNTSQNNYISNPKFVSSTDFHLQSGSLAINSGLELGLTSDYDGNPISGLPDIGAYEFINSDNRPPSIQDQGFRLNENSPGGTAVGTVVASDPDAGQTLTYSIVSGNTNGAFSINALTGALSVANGAALTVDFALVVKIQDNGVGELSSQATIVIDVIPTGIELTGNIATIRVYPNPVSDELVIEIKGNNDSPEFEILNSIGQIVFKGTLSERTVVQTADFSPGIYLVKIENRKSFEFKKIVKV